MFIILNYGEAKSLLLNANCGCKNFLNYIIQACDFSPEAVIDICDENGNVAFLSTKPNMEAVINSVLPKATYIPLLVDYKQPAEKSGRNFIPLLDDWQKYYPALEKKLKSAGDKNRKSGSTESPPRSGKKEKGIRDGKDAQSPDGSKRSSNARTKKKQA